MLTLAVGMGRCWVSRWRMALSFPEMGCWFVARLGGSLQMSMQSVWGRAAPDVVTTGLTKVTMLFKLCLAGCGCLGLPLGRVSQG